MIAMKKYIYALTAMVLLASCSPDLGNYEYVDLAEPVITGLEDQSVLSFSRLILTPTVELKNDAANYSFEWKAVDNNGLQSTSGPRFCGYRRTGQGCAQSFGYATAQRTTQNHMAF